MWISRCKLSTKEQAKEIQFWKEVVVVAKNANQRGRNSWQKGSGKKGSKGEEKGEQDTLQRGVERAATQICTPLMKMRVKTFKKHVTMMKSGKRGVYWQKV